MPPFNLSLRRWQIVMLATVFVVAGVYYYWHKGDAPLPSVMCINGADASGHSWPDELGRPDPCGLKASRTNLFPGYQAPGRA